jgi:hypothetical protein
MRKLQKSWNENGEAILNRIAMRTKFTSLLRCVEPTLLFFRRIAITRRHRYFF